MKSTLLAFSFLIFAFIEKPSVGVTTDAVLDREGEPLRTGVDYYIVSAIRGAGGGGLSLRKTRNQTCPFTVVLEPRDLFRGLPITFSPVEAEDGIVRESVDLNVKFNVKLNCEKSTVWKVDNYDNVTGQWFVSIGGVAGNPGHETLMNWFKIEKLSFIDSYKLVFCPSVCASCVAPCSDLGIHFENGFRRLGLSHQLFLVDFIKKQNLHIQKA